MCSLFTTINPSYYIAGTYMHVDNSKHVFATQRLGIFVKRVQGSNSKHYMHYYYYIS